MGGAPPILRVKLLPPRDTGTVLAARHRPLGRELVSHRLTVLTAGPGFGKSTLLAQALATLETGSLWYSLDESDGDPATFLRYLCAGLSAWNRNFDFPLPQDLTAQVPDRAGQTALMRELLVALEALAEPELVVVFDDFQTVQTCPAVRHLLDLLLRLAPPGVHFVVSSRTPVLLPLARLRAGRQLLELGTEELSLTSEETRELLDHTLDLHLDDAALGTVQHFCQGWLAGTILLGRRLKGWTGEQLSSGLEAGQLLEEVHDYFSEEVYQPLDAQTKEFLLASAVLDELEGSVCREVTGRGDCETFLTGLLRQGLFTRRAPETGQFSYHPLFLRFLRRQLAAEQSPAEVRSRHQAAARLYEQRALPVPALRQFLLAGDRDSLCRLLDRQGEQIIPQENRDLLDACLDLLGTEVPVEYPRVEFLRGWSHGQQGRPAAALSAYGTALEGFRQQGDRQGLQQTLLEIAISHYHVGAMDQAAASLEELLALPALCTDLRLEAAGYLIFLAAYGHDQPQGQGLYPKAAAILDDLEAGDLNLRQKAWLDVLRGYACNFLGDRIRALELGFSVAWRLQTLAGETGIHPCYGLIANVCFYLQRFAEGLEWAQKGLALLERDGETRARLSPSGDRERGAPDISYPLLLLHAANNAFGLGRTDEAITLARQGAARFRGMGHRWGEAWALNMLSTAYAQQGDLVLAEQSSLAALESYRGLNQPRLEGSIKGNLSVYLIARGRRAEALPLLEAVEKTFVLKHLLPWVDLWYANYDWHHNRDKGRGRLRRALTRFDERQDFGILAERHWIVPPLVDSYARGQFRNYIMTVLRKLGPDARRHIQEMLAAPLAAETKTAIAQLLRELPKPAPPGLKVYLLGPFRVTIGEREIPRRSWSNSKALTLLQYLAHEQPKGYIAREVLTELLWPEADPQKSRNRFHVAMSALRKMLEPGLPDGVPSAYISRSGESYRLQLGEEGFVDVHELTRRLRQAKKETDPAKACSLRMEALADYAGELLAEDPYCEWCAEARERLRRDVLETLEKLLRQAEIEEDFNGGIDYAERYLALEPTAEEIYRALMVLYARTDNLPMVSTTFNRCSANLQSELDCRPDPETESLTRQLLTNSK